VIKKNETHPTKKEMNKREKEYRNERDEKMKKEIC
jgi:hypothetical protein